MGEYELAAIASWKYDPNIRDILPILVKIICIDEDFVLVSEIPDQTYRVYDPALEIEFPQVKCGNEFDYSIQMTDYDGPSFSSILDNVVEIFSEDPNAAGSYTVLLTITN